MEVYLDNNIIIDIEKGNLKLPDVYNIDYPYSYVHIEELLESGNRLFERKEIRLSMLASMSKNKYMYQDNQQICFVDKSPYEVYGLFNPLVMQIKKVIKDLSNNFNIDEELKTKLEIDKNIINNLTASEFIKKYGSIIISYVNNTSSTLQEKFQSFFNILNAVGYWSDKAWKGSNLNRIYDANHAFYASACDYFVTNDKRTMMKANFLYKYYKINTKALSFDEFLNILSA
jgi:hypothetical protein